LFINISPLVKTDSAEVIKAARSNIFNINGFQLNAFVAPDFLNNLDILIKEISTT
jgi:hypothetical protein